MLQGLLRGRRGGSGSLDLLRRGRGCLALARRTRRGSYGGRIVSETHLDLRLLLLRRLDLLGLMLLLLLRKVILRLRGLRLADI